MAGRNGINEYRSRSKVGCVVYLFTDLLTREGYDITDLIGDGKISVKVLKGNNQILDAYNNPNKSISSNASMSESGTRLTANVMHGEYREYYGTVSNIQNLLGDHELMGHKFMGWRVAAGEHHKVYEYQMQQPSWKKTPPFYKNHVLNNYNKCKPR